MNFPLTQNSKQYIAEASLYVVKINRQWKSGKLQNFVSVISSNIFYTTVYVKKVSK